AWARSGLMSAQPTSSTPSRCWSTVPWTWAMPPQPTTPTRKFSMSTRLLCLGDARQDFFQRIERQLPGGFPVQGGAPLQRVLLQGGQAREVGEVGLQGQKALPAAAQQIGEDVPHVAVPLARGD